MKKKWVDNRNRKKCLLHQKTGSMKTEKKKFYDQSRKLFLIETTAKLVFFCFFEKLPQTHRQPHRPFKVSRVRRWLVCCFFSVVFFSAIRQKCNFINSFVFTYFVKFKFRIIGENVEIVWESYRLIGGSKLDSLTANSSAYKYISKIICSRQCRLQTFSQNK